LIGKIHRQLTVVSTPPRSGPAEDAAAPPIAHIATARAWRTGSGWAWAMSAMDDGITSAAASPWAKRNATSTPSCGAGPHAGDARVNPAIPSPNARRAPIRSASEPAESRAAANVSV
jgi:hypothetical protein